MHRKKDLENATDYLEVVINEYTDSRFIKIDIDKVQKLIAEIKNTITNSSNDAPTLLNPALTEVTKTVYKSTLHNPPGSSENIQTKLQNGIKSLEMPNTIQQEVTRRPYIAQYIQRI